MSRRSTARGFQASVTPQHNATVPLHNDVALKDDERITPPEIAEGEAWYAVTIAPRGERRTLTSLTEAKITGYVPMETYWIESVKLKLKEKRETQKPILPGYVFVRIPPKSGLWYALKQKYRDGRNVHGVGGIISLAQDGADPAGSEEDGRSLAAARGLGKLLAKLAREERDGWFDERRRRALEVQRNPEMTGPLLRAGESLKIVGGAFATYQGTAEADSSSDAVRALVDIFGRATLIVVPLDQVENLSRDVQRDPIGSTPIHRADTMSGLAQAQNSLPVGWQAIEERRLKQREHDIWEQSVGKRPLKVRA